MIWEPPCFVKPINNIYKMLIIRSVEELLEFVAADKAQGRSCGLVPTMGALHAGHLSLVKRSKSDNSTTVVSVFVNPTQFNNPVDLATYPRDEEADFRLLAQEGVDAVFAPTPEEVYPEGIKAAAEYVFDLGSVAEVLEGAMRPGHFQGVAQIVSRLLRLVRPDRAYFGMKDFQQVAVVRHMVKTEKIPVEIIACPIMRADDGLALSSRNTLLDKGQRAAAPEIHATLLKALGLSETISVNEVRKFVTDHLNSIPGFKVEYFAIVDGETLIPVETWNESAWTVGLITVYVGEIRLIDNIIFRQPQN